MSLLAPVVVTCDGVLVPPLGRFLFSVVFLELPLVSSELAFNKLAMTSAAFTGVESFVMESFASEVVGMSGGRGPGVCGPPGELGLRLPNPAMANGFIKGDPDIDAI